MSRKQNTEEYVPIHVDMDTISFLTEVLLPISVANKESGRGKFLNTYSAEETDALISAGTSDNGFLRDLAVQLVLEAYAPRLKTIEYQLKQDVGDGLCDVYGSADDFRQNVSIAIFKGFFRYSKSNPSGAQFATYIDGAITGTKIDHQRRIISDTTGRHVDIIREEKKIREALDSLKAMGKKPTVDNVHHWLKKHKGITMSCKTISCALSEMEYSRVSESACLKELASSRSSENPEEQAMLSEKRDMFKAALDRIRVREEREMGDLIFRSVCLNEIAKDEIVEVYLEGHPWVKSIEAQTLYEGTVSTLTALLSCDPSCRRAFDGGLRIGDQVETYSDTDIASRYIDGFREIKMNGGTLSPA